MSLRKQAALAAFAALSCLAGAANAQAPTSCDSKQLTAAFEDFGRTGKMPPDLGRWLSDPKAQYIEPYRAFDNVYFVGVCWVSAWLIKTPEGPVLIDTLHDPFTDILIENLKKVGVAPADLRYVLMTHGHFDHAGGAYKLKPLTKARFVMTQSGWDEAARSVKATQGTPRQWRFIDQDVVAKDGDAFTVGGEKFTLYETPGHTFGTASYGFRVRDGDKTYNAFTVGGLGLNAIENSKQVEAYIASVTRIAGLLKQPQDPVTVHLTTHPFSTGLTEAKDRIPSRKPGEPHPLVDPAGFAAQLAALRKGAVERLEIEKKAGR